MGPYRDEENFLPFQTNYEFLCRGCNYPEWTERFRLTKSSWVQSVLSAQASLMHRYQRYCFKVAEVKQFVDEHWDLICVDEDKDGQPFPKDRRGGKWEGPFNSYWTTHEKKYFYKPLRNYWGLQPEKGTAQEKEDFGPALSPQHLFRSHDRREPPAESTGPQITFRPKKTKIKVQKFKLKGPQQDEFNNFPQPLEEPEAICPVCRLGARKLGNIQRNNKYCRKCEQDKMELTPIPRYGEKGYEGSVVASHLWYDGTTEQIWLCGRCEKKVRRDQEFTMTPFEQAPVTIPYKKFIHQPPPADPEEAWVGCNFCTDDSVAWHHERCVGFDQQIAGDADWCCRRPACRKKHAEKLMAGQDTGASPVAASPSTAQEVDNTIAQLEQRYSSTDLPCTPIASHIEGFVSAALKKEGARVTVRVVSNTVETNKIPEHVASRYKLEGEIQFMQKQIYAFYSPEPEGAEVCFFGLQVQEYGPDAPSPHDNVAYLAYLDSCQLYHCAGCKAHKDEIGHDIWTEPDCEKHSTCTSPKECREAGRRLYRALMHGYMDTLRLRGYRELWIWVMAPSVTDPNDPNADYMFNYRPGFQYIPKQKQLESWYKKLLDSAVDAQILQRVDDNTGLAKTDQDKTEKEVRPIDFAFTSDHTRGGAAASPKSGAAAAAEEEEEEEGGRAKKRGKKGSPKGAKGGRKRKAAEEPAEEEPEGGRRSKRTRKSEPKAAEAAAAAAAAAEPEEYTAKNNEQPKAIAAKLGAPHLACCGLLRFASSDRRLLPMRPGISVSDLVRLNVETYPGLKGTSRLQDGTVLQLPRAAEAPESSDASPTKLGQGEMAKLAGKAWSERLALRELPNGRLEPEICLSSSEELGEEGQAPYVALSEQDRARYQKDMETYVPPAKVRVVTRRKKKAPVRASMPISSKVCWLLMDGWRAAVTGGGRRGGGCAGSRQAAAEGRE